MHVEIDYGIKFHGASNGYLSRIIKILVFKIQNVKKNHIIFQLRIFFEIFKIKNPLPVPEI